VYEPVVGATVAVTRPLPAPGTRPLLHAGLRVVANDHDRVLEPAELLELVADADALICTLSDRIDDAVLDAAPRLRVVANVAVGFDNVDVAAARARGVEVTTTPDVLTEATADLTWALVLAAARRLGEGERLVRTGAWPGWAPTQLLGQPVWGARMGIVGLGAIGRAVARRARGFGMHVAYSNRRRLAPELEADLGVVAVDLDELFATSDVVSLHAPLSAATHHLVDERRLSLMKPTAVLVNTARGPLVDEAALVRALDEGRLFAAGLDVYEREPVVHPGLLGREDVVLAPHLGSATTAARSAMVGLCVANVLEVLAGRPARTPAPGPRPSPST
jgi:glyoxylate reductase